MSISSFGAAKVIHKWLLSLLIFLTFIFSASAQMRLQWHWPVFPASQVEVTATLQLHSIPEVKDTLVLQFFNHYVQDIRLRQGRIKEHLPYRHEQNTLRISLAHIEHRRRSSIEINYRININDSRWQAYLHRDSSLLVLSPYNLNGGASGPAGLWYPAPAKQALFVRTDVRVPLQWEVLAPGALQFKVRGAKYYAAFRQMEEPRFSDHYFLAVGNFEQGSTAKDLDKDMKLSEMAEEQMLQAQTQMQLKELRDFLRKQGGPLLSDTIIKQLRGPAPSVNHPLLSPSHPWIASSAEAYYKQYAALQKLYPDTLEAQLLFWDFAAQHQSSSGRRRTLDSLWQAPQVPLLVTTLYARQYEEEFPPALSGVLRKEAQKLAMHLKNGGAIPQGNLRMTYKKGEQQFWLMHTLKPAVAVPFGYRIYLQDSIIEGTEVLRGAADTLRIALPQAPQSMTVEWWHAPAHITVYKPDMYWLRALQKASSAAEGREALQALLRTKNLNLLATVLGIAMESPAARIRLLALQNYSRLPAAGKLRLKSTLQNMAQEDTNAALRQMAAEILKKGEG